MPLWNTLYWDNIHLCGNYKESQLNLTEEKYIFSAQSICDVFSTKNNQTYGAVSDYYNTSLSFNTVTYQL